MTKKLNNYFDVYAEEINNITKILKSIKVFLKKRAKVLYNVLILINKVYEFFENKYSALTNRMFFYIKIIIITLTLND